MSHIHLPDGILPSWLWISGLIAAILVWAILLRFMKKAELARRLPLLGMMAAAMVLGASMEIVPIAYHVNLTVISGILLGPRLIFLATFVVNVILALFGHGGITVIGLNTLTLSIEGILGYAFFRLFHKVFRRLTRSTALSPALEGGDSKRRSGSTLSKLRHLCRGADGLSLTTFLATFLALFLSTLSMIGVVSLGTSHYGELIHREEGGGIFEFKLLQEEEAHPEGATGEKEVNLGRFVAVVLPLGLIGWVLEGIITMLMVRYIHRLRPDLLGLEGEAP